MIGVNAPAMVWSLPEGADGGMFDTYTLIANPNFTPRDARYHVLLRRRDAGHRARESAADRARARPLDDGHEQPLAAAAGEPANSARWWAARSRRASACSSRPRRSWSSTRSTGTCCPAPCGAAAARPSAFRTNRRPSAGTLPDHARALPQRPRVILFPGPNPAHPPRQTSAACPLQSPLPSPPDARRSASCSPRCRRSCTRSCSRGSSA